MAFTLTFNISIRPSTQQQQLVTIFNAISNMSKLACTVLGLLVSATQYSMMECKNAFELMAKCGVVEIALHAGKAKGKIINISTLILEQLDNFNLTRQRIITNEHEHFHENILKISINANRWPKFLTC